jgi:cation:H+ antiporter
MPWIIFLISAVIITVAAMQLAKYGDVIAIRTRLGGMFIGLILLAGVTSLPELLTSINSIQHNEPNLAAGNLLGSCMFNMFLLAVLDLAHHKRRILRKAALKHSLSGSLAIFLIGLVVFFNLADINLKIGWVGVDSLIIMAAYIVGIRLLQKNANLSDAPITEEDIPEGTPSLRRGLIGFGLATAALIFITPYMVKSSSDIAKITGLGTTFIGSTLVAVITSLPELVTTLAAARISADDMAIGNLFGSNMFNMFALGITDVFDLQGRFLASIDPAFLIVGMLGLLMTGMGLIGNLARIRRRFFIVELDSMALVVMYAAGLWLLYVRGIAP